MSVPSTLQPDAKEGRTCVPVEGNPVRGIELESIEDAEQPMLLDRRLSEIDHQGVGCRREDEHTKTMSAPSPWRSQRPSKGCPSECCAGKMRRRPTVLFEIAECGVFWQLRHSPVSPQDPVFSPVPTMERLGEPGLAGGTATSGLQAALGSGPAFQYWDHERDNGTRQFSKVERLAWGQAGDQRLDAGDDLDLALL